MKRNLMAAAALTLLTITVAGLTGCDKDSDDTLNNDDNKPVAAVMDYSLTVGDDMLSLLDLAIEYYDADGKVQTEALTEKSWKKSVRAKLPATLGARLKMQLKDGADPSSLAKFTASYGYSYNGYAVSVTDKVVGNVVNSANDYTLSMQGDKVTAWLERHTDGLVKFLYTFDAAGKSTAASWE